MTKLIDSDWLTAVQFFFVNSEERLSYFRAKTFFFFKKLKLHSPYGLMQFNTFEKPTSANYFQIEREKSYDYLFTFFNKLASFWNTLHHSICFCFVFYQKLTFYKPQNLEKHNSLVSWQNLKVRGSTTYNLLRDKLLCLHVYNDYMPCR